VAQRVLYLLALLFCLVMHLATFFSTAPLYWIVMPAALLVISDMLRRTTGVAAVPGFTFGRAEVGVGIGLLAYAVMMFIYVYRSTGGAASVAVQNGHYVSLYKDRVMKTISHDEFVMFPSLWLRALSAWFGALA
jgi:hypothetical protein